MPEQRKFKASIEIGGNVDSSLRSTFRQIAQSVKGIEGTVLSSNKQLSSIREQFTYLSRQVKSTNLHVASVGKQFGYVRRNIDAAIRHTSSLKGQFGSLEHKSVGSVNRIRHSFDQLRYSSDRAGHSIRTALSPLRGLGIVLGGAGGIARGVGSVVGGIGSLTGISTLLAGGFAAFEGARFLKFSSHVWADRESLQNQMKTILSAQGKGGQAESFFSMIRNLSGNDAPIRFEPAMRTANQLLAADPVKFGSVKAMDWIMHALTDLSRDENSFRLVGQAYAKIQALQKADWRHIFEITNDSGFSILGAMAQIAGISPDQLQHAIAHNKMPKKQSRALLDMAIQSLVGPGGPAFGHAKAQMEGWLGILKQTEERFRDLGQATGELVATITGPFIHDLYKGVTPDSLTHIFDPIMPQARELGQNLKQFSGVLPAVGSVFKSLFGDVSAFGGGVLSAFGQGDRQKGYTGMPSLSWETYEKKLAAQSGNYLDQFGNLKLPLDSPIPDFKVNMKSKLPDVASMGFQLNVPNVELTFFDNLKIGILDFSDALKDLTPKFEALGNSVGELIKKFENIKDGIEIITRFTAPYLPFIESAWGLNNNAVSKSHKWKGWLTPTLDQAEKNYDKWRQKKRHSIEENSNEPVIKLPGWATGSIIRSPHLGMVGEAGPEAIIPLKRSKRSLGLLDATAGALGVGTTSVPQTVHKTFSPSITVNVNGSHTEGVGQLVAEAVLEALQKAQEEDYRRVAG